MSWTEELYRVYETQSGAEHEDSEHRLLCVAHSTANAQIEITIDENGTFVDAKALSKEEGQKTVIPVTESSGARANGIAPMPLADKLKYIAGDYEKYTSIDNSEYFTKYIDQLKAWKDSVHTHPAVNALFVYLSKKSVISDLLGINGILEQDDKGMLTDKNKIAGIDQKDAFVRFVVQYSNLNRNQKTYEDKTLYESFIGFNSTLTDNIGLCYATGKTGPVTENHPSKIRNTGDKAKLISANDTSNYTYRGRFKTKSEAVSVGYDFSQKVHNALKWLIERQGKNYSGMTVVVWSSVLAELPNISGSADDDLFGDMFEETPDTMPVYKEYLSKSIFSRKANIPINSKVMIMGLDAATTGRMSVSLYSELTCSDFYENIKKWHTDTAVRKFSSKRKKVMIDSVGVHDIINCAFGYENSKGRLECKEDIVSDTALRLIPCITEGRPLQSDIMWALYHRASSPLLFEHSYNHRQTLEAACGIIQKYYKDHNYFGKGEISMAYDPKECDRSYLYGCLLAIADAAERDAYDDGDKGERVTNARRYWNTFSKRPFMTWQRIEEQLLPYLNKLGAKRVRYEKMLQDIKGKFTASNFADNTSLSPLYLLGFHHYTAEIFTSKKKEEN